jgi:hypothetical protein
MEVPLFVALATAALARHVRERRDPGLPALSLALFAAAALARPEGLLLLPLAVLDRAMACERDASGALRRAALGRAGWRRLAAGALAAAILLGAVALVYASLWGSPLPTTLAAKSPGEPRWIPEVRLLRGVAGLLFAAQPWALLLAGGGAVHLLARLGTPRDRGLLLPLWTVALPVATAMLSSGQGIVVGNFGRYFFPLLPCLALLAVLALEPLPPGWGRWRLASGRALPVLGPLALALLFAPSLSGLFEAGRVHLQARGNVDDSDVAAARFVVERIPPEAVLAVCDIGAIRYLAPNPIFDLAGIVDPEVIAEVRRAEREEGLDWMRALARQIERRRPDYVLLYPRWYPLLDRDPARFPVAHRLAIADNVAMAGEELVLYQTPWTRYPLGPPVAAEPRSTP